MNTIKILLIIFAAMLCALSVLASNLMTLATTLAIWAVAVLQLALLCDRK